MGKPTITIEFTDDVEVLDHNKVVEFSARAGEVRELVAPSARFWLTRDKAKVIQGKPKPAPEKAPAPSAQQDEAPAPEKKPAPKKKRAPRKKSETAG